MTVNFPPTCTSDASRMAWCYRAQEKLRLVHNGVGKWWRTGLTQNQYNQFPTKIKNRYPYVAQISKADWDDFESNVFEPVSIAIMAALNVARQDAKDSTYWSPDLDGDIN